MGVQAIGGEVVPARDKQSPSPRFEPWRAKQYYREFSLFIAREWHEANRGDIAHKRRPVRLFHQHPKNLQIVLRADWDYQTPPNRKLLD